MFGSAFEPLPADADPKEAARALRDDKNKVIRAVALCDARVRGSHTRNDAGL